ncbi:MAG: NUDIX domain-containing protein [Patescibacteria group bacterium]|nr:NUDIX domain-containing protein [Patescibacteria group bacterium]MDE2439252.1 NUDIX domain-containing protein [Patescibacteria group bacterium]
MSCVCLDSVMLKSNTPLFRCVLHGSFRKHFRGIQHVRRLFTENGIDVLAPTLSEVERIEDGFAILKSDTSHDRRMIELLYLHNLKRLGSDGFSYFVNPDGYLGASASYELGIAHVANVPCFFNEALKDHPAYVHNNAVVTPEQLVRYIKRFGTLPSPRAERNERAIHKLWEDLMVPGSVVAVGGIIEYDAPKSKKEREVLLVRTHKWGGLFSIVGGKVRRNERLDGALGREIAEETGLRASVGADICTFDQIKNSGYYHAGVQHIFVDKAVRVGSKRVKLNDEAEDYLWIPARVALRDLPIEPNARHTLECYVNMSG